MRSAIERIKLQGGFCPSWPRDWMATPRARIQLPSSGGTGQRLKTARITFRKRSIWHIQNKGYTTPCTEITMGSIDRVTTFTNSRHAPANTIFGGRPGRGNQKVLPSGISQASGVDGHRLGPFENEPDEKESQERKNNGPHRVDMGQRIQRDAPQAPPRRISQPLGRPGVGGLMDAQ